MLTKRNKDGYAVPIDCRKDICEYKHCNDCAYVGKEAIFRIIDRLCKYEEIILKFKKCEVENE